MAPTGTMRIELTRRARREYKALIPRLQKAVIKQFDLLLADRRHPSIQAKKYDEARSIWQGRVNRDYRFYFVIEDDRYVILSIIPHPK